MNAFEFLKRHGKATAEAVAIAAGTNWAYFSQLAYGHRRPSLAMAERLVAASEGVFAEAGDRLDLLSLLKGPPARQERDETGKDERAGTAAA